MNRDDILRMAIQCQLITTGNRDGIYMEALEHFADLVTAAEREACARVCEEHAAEIHGYDKHGYADAIRAMGEK